MPSNTEHGSADALRKEALALHRALGGGIDSALQDAGYTLVGLSLKVGEGDCLLTLRLDNHEGAFVAFVGGQSVPTCLVKALREVRGGKLSYRQDKYKNGT